MRVVPINPNVPINYLEIGVFYGIHAIEVSDVLKHPDSKVCCVDPWEDYAEYNEYKGKIHSVWDSFKRNIVKSPSREKFSVHRGFSHTVVPQFPDNHFDIIYVDGNHETDYVYRDGVVSYQKAKSGGYIIFDDSDWEMTKAGIHRFIEEYSDRVRVIADLNMQLVVQKL